MKEKTQQVRAFKLDISQTDKEGAFQCPNCRVQISPDDKTDIAYSIYEIKMKDNTLYELVLHCNRCLSFIYMTGFAKIGEKTT